MTTKLTMVSILVGGKLYTHFVHAEQRDGLSIVSVKQYDEILRRSEIVRGETYYSQGYYPKVER